MALTTAFCVNGNKATIPQTTTDGTVSYDQGFGSLYALPPEEGGKFIDRAQFNQLMYDISSQVIANTNAIATKANATAVVNLNGNQTINNIKTFSVPPVSATNPTANNQVANKAYVDSVGNTAVKLTGAQSIAGAKTFTSNITAPNITAMQNNLNTIFSSTTSPVKAQTTTKVITVGTGGNFQNLQDAFAEAIKYTSPVTVSLISDLNSDANISINKVNGSNITFNFNNFKIKNTSSQTISLGFNNSRIGSIANLRLEGCIFACVNNSNTYLTGSVNIQNGNWAYADCLRAWNTSFIGMVDDLEINLKHGAGQSSIWSAEGSIISVGEDSTINDNSLDGICFRTSYGGIINTSNATLYMSITKANQAANTPTASGIIFGNYSL